MNTTANTAQLMTALAHAEDAVKTTRREEARTERAAGRAVTHATNARTAATAARKDLRKAVRAGQGVAPAFRRVTRLTAKAEALGTAAREAKATATTARRAARAAARRLDRIGRRAAVAAARTVEQVAQRLGETSLSPAAEADRVLAAADIPAVEEIETRAAQFANLDRRAKNLTKQAEGIKTWLRTLPTGTYGRVVITRTAGRSVLDSAQVALDYATRDQMPPRKLTKTTFKADTTTLLADLAEAAVRAAQEATFTVDMSNLRFTA